MTRARHRLALLAACLGVSAVAGCAVASPGQPAGGTARRSAAAPASAAPASAVASPPAARPASPATSPGPSPSASQMGVNVAAFDALARQEASAWPNSALGKVWKTGLVIPVADDLSSGPSGGFPSGETKIAFGNGNLVLQRPAEGRASGSSPGPTGENEGVLLDEAQVFRALKQHRGQVPRLRDDAARRHCRYSRRPASSPRAGHRQRPGLGIHAAGRVRAGHPGGAPAGQLRHAVLPPPATRASSARSARSRSGRRDAAADGRTLTLTLEGSPCETSWGGLVAEAALVVAGGWMQTRTRTRPRREPGGRHRDCNAR